MFCINDNFIAPKINKILKTRIKRVLFAIEIISHLLKYPISSTSTTMSKIILPVATAICSLSDISRATELLLERWHAISSGRFTRLHRGTDKRTSCTGKTQFGPSFLIPNAGRAPFSVFCIFRRSYFFSRTSECFLSILSHYFPLQLHTNNISDKKWIPEKKTYLAPSRSLWE